MVSGDLPGFVSTPPKPAMIAAERCNRQGPVASRQCQTLALYPRYLGVMVALSSVATFRHLPGTAPIGCDRLNLDAEGFRTRNVY
jgi:hypothetical protein